MRLLQSNGTGAVTLTEDLSDDEIPRPYAILSHTWGAKEVILQDLQQQDVTRRPEYKKIRFCAQQAKRDGIKYFWVDSCCIDKTNDAELARAIKSMFRWYAQAEKCYVFLADVPSLRNGPEADMDAAIRKSRWFTRGWTLQELLAPTTVEFFSASGDKLGDRVSLERQICDITRIPVRALRGSPISTFSREERFSWQQGRQTKVPEDMAYSMLGIFDVSMPVLYGEGAEQARRRLVREVDLNTKGTHYEHFSVPSPDLRPTPYFIARESELESMRTTLSSDGSRRMVVLHGLGGIGKTQLAIAYAKRYRDTHSATFWINIKDDFSVKQSFVRMAQQISQAHPTVKSLHDVQQNPDEAVDAVKSWLSIQHNTRWLLIFDNYDNPKISGNDDPQAVNLRKYLPYADQGSVIITTRSSEVESEHALPVRKLQETRTSLELLSRTSTRSELSGDDNALKLAKRLDGLPLALVTAGAYLRQSTVTFEDYLRSYEDSWANLQKTSPNVTSYEDRTLYSTWQLSYDHIKQRSQVAANVLRLWAYFDNEDVWFELLNHANDESPDWFRELTEDENTFESVFRTLYDHGLVEADVDANTVVESRGYSIHSCVHSWTKTVLTADLDHELAGVALECVGSHVPPPDHRYGWYTERRMLNHALQLSPVLEHESGMTLARALVYMHIGLLFESAGRLDEAEKWLQKVLECYEILRVVQPGEDAEIETARTAVHLGMLYGTQGRPEKAEEMFVRGINGYRPFQELEFVRRFMHVTTHNLGVLYETQGRLDEAEKMLVSALEGLESMDGADDPTRLNTVYHLGDLYKHQGKLEEAETMYLRALQGREEAFEENNPKTLDTLSKLGQLYTQQKRWEEAEKMYLRVLRGYETSVGQDDIETLKTAYELGIFYQMQHRFDNAAQFLQRAAVGYQAFHGNNHQHTWDAWTHLSHVLVRLHRFEEAGEVRTQLQAAYREAYGDDHPKTLNATTDVGTALFYQGRVADAQTAYDRALQGYEGMDDHQRHHVDILGHLLRHHAHEMQDEQPETAYDHAHEVQDEQPQTAYDRALQVYEGLDDQQRHEVDTIQRMLRYYAPDIMRDEPSGSRVRSASPGENDHDPQQSSKRRRSSQLETFPDAEKQVLRKRFANCFASM